MKKLFHKGLCLVMVLCAGLSAAMPPKDRSPVRKGRGMT